MFRAVRDSQARNKRDAAMRGGGARPFLSLTNAAFRLGEGLVFEGTSWVYGRGEQWAIIGANGSGKSLLGDALRGMLPLVQGELRYHFRSPDGLTAEESIGHVSFEDRKHDVHELVVQSRWNSLEEDGALVVRDFLSYERVMDINPFEVSARHEQTRKQFERRRRRAVDLLRIAPYLERTLLSLSNGERQRVQLAQALCHPLRLLILDEPFVGLDAAMRGYFGRLLEELMKTSLRVLLLTMRLDDLPRQITHLLWVDQCRVAGAGLRAEVMGMQGVRRLQGAGRISARGGAKEQGARKRPSDGTMEARELVRLRGVTVRYGESTILEGVDWTVCARESWALLGPNGSGKTTLLSLIQGDNPQVYRNDVAVFGRPRGTGESIWEVKRRIGWVSPELQLHFNDAATCLDVVVSGFQDTIGVFHQPTSRQRAAARSWMERFQLLEFARSPLYALSAGWQRMVLLARALVKEPELLILDEPCQGLDPAHRSDFVRVVDELLRHGTVTAIYVTHRPDEIPRSIRRVLRLTGSGKWRVTDASVAAGADGAASSW